MRIWNKELLLNGNRTINLNRIFLQLIMLVIIGMYLIFEETIID
jgi:hypothetical protein